MTELSIGGAVLCGGRSERFGRDKALVEINGQPMAEHVAAVVESAGCAPVVFVGGVGASLGSAHRSSVHRRHLAGRGTAGRRRRCSPVVPAPTTSMGSSSWRATCPSSASTPFGPLPDERGAAVAVAERLQPALARWPTSAADQRRAVVHLWSALVARGAGSARRGTRDRSRPQHCTTSIARRISPISL